MAAARARGRKGGRPKGLSKKAQHTAIIAEKLYEEGELTIKEICAITFGLLHERTMYGFLVTGLLYSLAMAAVFTRRDWEHAVGAHYMINMIPSLMVYLETL